MSHIMRETQKLTTMRTPMHTICARLGRLSTVSTSEMDTATSWLIEGCR